MNQKDVINLIESIQNRCEALIILHDHAPKCYMTEHIFHTICEDIATDSLEILEGFCVESEETACSKE
jgi:hypothetical protein